jgi:hypothetical protein
MHRGQGAKRAKSKLAGLSKFQVAGDQHGLNIPQVHFASIRLKTAETIVSRERTVRLEHNIRAANLVPTRFKHGSSKHDVISAVTVHP